MFRPRLKFKDYSLPLLIITEKDNYYIRNKKTLIEPFKNTNVELEIEIERIFECPSKDKILRDYVNYNPYHFENIDSIKIMDDSLVLGIEYVFSYPLYLSYQQKDIFTQPTYFLKNIEDETIIWKSNSLINPKIIKNYIFSEDVEETSIKCHEAESLNILWHKNLSQEFEGLKISNFIGVYKDILVVGLGTTSDVNNYLVALNIHNGEVLWSENTIFQFYKINKDDGALYLFNAGFLKRDIHTGKILDKYVNKEIFGLDKFLSYRDNYVITDNYIISTDDKKGKIGAFNTITHQFDWIHEEPKTWFPGGHPMVYKAPYLFVQDSENTVHIFERMQ